MITKNATSNIGRSPWETSMRIALDENQRKLNSITEKQQK